MGDHCRKGSARKKEKEKPMPLVIYRGERKQGVSCIAESPQYMEGARNAQEVLERYSLEDLRQWKTLDLYYILGLRRDRDEKRGPLEFKEAYKRQAKMFHPDSLKSKSLDDGGLLFIALNRALQVMTDPAKKSLYDDFFFDESIPEDRAYEEAEFFRAFGEAFQRNSRFSAKSPVPAMGTAASTEAEVRGFYKFWQTFESARAFEFMCEDEDCPNREGRRHVAKQNRKIVADRKMEDNLRIRRLVSLAMKRDPRVSQKAGRSKEAKENKENKEEVRDDGWSSVEASALERAASTYPPSSKNRLDLIYAAFKKAAQSARTKKEVLLKMVQLEQEARSRNKK